MRHLLILCLALAGSCATAQTYRWVDSAGRTNIADTAPPGTARDLARTGGPAEADSGLPFATRKAMEAFPVVLYTTADCLNDCKQARELLNGRGIPFSEKMLQKPEDYDELKALVGDTFIPSLKVGKQASRGFEAGAYHNLLDLAGYPKTAPGGKAAGGASK